MHHRRRQNDSSEWQVLKEWQAVASNGEEWQEKECNATEARESNQIQCEVA